MTNQRKPTAAEYAAYTTNVSKVCQPMMAWSKWDNKLVPWEPAPQDWADIIAGAQAVLDLADRIRAEREALKNET